MFKSVNSRVNFPQVEGKILDLWREGNIFQKSVDNREGNPAFVMYEGPPTTNASPGLHFAMPRAIKDVFPRYKAMKGYHTPRIGGWDTQGLPVEIEVEKKLGFSGKAQIEEYGIKEFNALCRETVLGYIKEFEEMTERIGYWVDMENAYVTMKNSYIETCWWALKQMWDKGLIYQGHRVTPHCPRCETSLSSHEVAQGYKDDTEDPSIYIKFRIVQSSLGESRLAELFGSSDKPAYFLAWTTTPWTLPGNIALAVAPDAEYVVAELENEYLIMASSLLGVSVTDEYKVVEKLQGEELVGIHYTPLFEINIQYTPDDVKAYRIIAGDFVSMDDGTGIVHIAPAYGEIDYEVGEKENLPLVNTVNLNGTITTGMVISSTPAAREFTRKGGETPVSMMPAMSLTEIPGAGKFVKEADPLILEYLKKKGLLYRSETTKHTYPFCWRCDSPLLYYAKQTWYIKTTEVKERLISGNKEIKWYPDYIQYGRFGDWLENNVDWALSRERYWGTPLPVWKCTHPACKAVECVGGVEDLKSRPGVTEFAEPLDMHRPFVDNVTFTCPECGGTMKRVPEVIDAWFDSGAMPISQSHYPFENQTLLEDGRFPADFICEAIDQTRGWFYSLHAISTLLFDKPSFRNVICHGHIQDSKGQKMSKTKGNVVNLQDMLDKYGGDALRWYIYTAVPMGSSMRFDEKTIAEISRRVFMTLWNVYSFFVTYANIDKYVPGLKETGETQSELDRWILSGLNKLILDVDNALDNYDPRTGAWQIAEFIDELSNWYVRRSRRRFWKSENDTDKLSAYNTLYECLVTLTKLMAPFTPFLAEELYQNLAGSSGGDNPESVHLTDFPVADESKIDTELSEANKLAMKVSSLGRAARSKAGIKVRQPLSVNFIGVGTDREKRALENDSIMQTVLDELNVKSVEVKSFKEVGELDGKEGYVVVS
ncbi:MAG TPA: isoleucine--tRNA ligase, partial [Dehalococcoidia bacterium]|nr:isoleucine--tRNA ligase [Dehalococcoidia bacterium]